MRKLLIILALLVLPTFAFAQIYTVEEVVDCATLKLTNGETVRMIGIDCPSSDVDDKVREYAQRTGMDLETVTRIGKDCENYFWMFIKAGDEIKLDYGANRIYKDGEVLAYVWYRAFNDKKYYEPEMQECRLEDDTVWCNMNAVIIRGGFSAIIENGVDPRYLSIFRQVEKAPKYYCYGLYKTDECNEILKEDMDARRRAISMTVIVAAIFGIIFIGLLIGISYLFYKLINSAIMRLKRNE
jgi:hypothetical protein